MNRIILIGNGFDLAHELPTSYKDFINYQWKTIVDDSKNEDELYEDKYKFVKFTIKSQQISIQNQLKKELDNEHLKTYDLLCKCIANFKSCSGSDIELVVKNHFFYHLTKKINNGIENWVDIEVEYYKFLCNSIEMKDPKYNYNGGVKQLNADFEMVKLALCDYLSNLLYNDIKFQEIKPLKRIQNIINSTFVNSDFPSTAGIDFLEINNKKPNYNLFINVNYTRLENLYIIRDDPQNPVIHLHGLIRNQSENSIIFGYGNIKDEYYPQIKNLDNEDLINIKSTNYIKTSDYRQIVEFINSDNYQIIILGHSCGNSDGDLLNLLFENSHCKSIKPYYFEEIDKNGKNKNNHNDIAINISRHFYKNENYLNLIVPANHCSAFSIQK